MGWRTVLRAAVPRANCPEHGVRQVQVPWAEPYSRQTMRFEVEVIDDLLQMNVRQVARKRGLSWNRIDGIQARAVARGLARRDLQPPRRIGIDETSFQQRHEYVTLVVEHRPARVPYVADGKGRSAIDPFFKGLGEAACGRLEAAAMWTWRRPASARSRSIPAPTSASTASMWRSCSTRRWTRFAAPSTGP